MSALKTRRPTGKPPWPIVLLAGAEKAGKSWSCAVASSSDLIGRTLWIGMGEDDPDEYANVPGADFEIVEHDGTFRGFMDALLAAVAEPPVDGKPTLIVVDSMTRVWNVLTDMAQATANDRARRKGRNTDSADISMDLWNLAKSRWGNVMDALRSHDGPVLLTARLDEVTVMDGGKPTTEKMLKVQAEKSLPYDVGAVVEMPERGKVFLKGVRSARLQLAERIQWDAFTVDEFWRRLGLAETGATAPRQHTAARGVAPVDQPWDEYIAAATTIDEVRAIWRRMTEEQVLDAHWKSLLEARAQQINHPTAGEDGPATDGPAAVDSRKATRGELQQLAIVLGDLGIKDRQDTLDWCGALIGREIDSKSELTRTEVAVLIRRAREELADEAAAVGA